MWRVALVSVVLLAVWGGLSARLVQLHLGPNRELREGVRRQHRIRQNLQVGRGRILDRNGNTLALDLTHYDIVVTPGEVYSNRQVHVFSSHLSRTLGKDYTEVFQRINTPHSQYYRLERQAPEGLAERVRRLQLPGMRFDAVNTRQYPQGALASHLIGFVNLEGLGSGGTEQRWDSLIKGRAGFRLGEKDGLRREVYSRRSLEVSPQEGANVHLTIDQNVQYFVERGLDYAMTTFHPEAAWAIAQEVRTGAILAMATRPTFDPNRYNEFPDEARMNRAIGYNFEPGSIFKVAVVAAAINEGVVRTNDVFDCERGLWSYAGRPLRDYRSHGELDVTGILRKSSNIGAAKIAVELGEDRLYRYLREFGVGRRTEIELPGEEAGFLAHPKDWYPISITRIAMGHQVSVTALQMLNMMCAIGNDGFLMRPYLVQRVVDRDGVVLHQGAPDVIARPVTERTAALMRTMLTEVTRPGGTGERAAVAGYAVAGKTGTAQKVLPGGGYAQRENVAAFMGMLPAHRPEIAFIVVLDNPQPLRTGGRTAAEVFALMAKPAARYLDIQPSDGAAARGGP